MFAEAGGSHHVPHFHVVYQDFESIFRIDPVAMIAGAMPVRQARLVHTWASLHHAELRANWARLCLGESPSPIEPLRLRP
jgi:hypothetical protein